MRCHPLRRLNEKERDMVCRPDGMEPPRHSERSLQTMSEKLNKEAIKDRLRNWPAESVA